MARPAPRPSSQSCGRPPPAALGRWPWKCLLQLSDPCVTRPLMLPGRAFGTLPILRPFPIALLSPIARFNHPMHEPPRPLVVQPVVRGPAEPWAVEPDGDQRGQAGQRLFGAAMAERVGRVAAVGARGGRGRAGPEAGDVRPAVPCAN